MENEERRVWIAQCLCGPHRHCILAAADECDNEADAKAKLLPILREGVATCLEGSPGVIAPWCSICGADESGWQYEVGRTPLRTMAEAKPALLNEQVKQSLTNFIYGTHGPDKPGSA